MDDEKTIVTLVILCVLSAFLFTFSIRSLNENSRLEKEAIRRGYATYSQDGEFIWNTQNEKSN